MSEFAKSRHGFRENRFDETQKRGKKKREKETLASKTEYETRSNSHYGEFLVPQSGEFV